MTAATAPQSASSQPQGAAVAVLLYTALTIRIIAESVVRKCVELTSTETQSSVFEKLYTLAALQKLNALTTSTPSSSRTSSESRTSSVDALSPGLSPSWTQVEKQLPPPGDDDSPERTDDRNNDSDASTTVHTLDRPLPHTPTGLPRFHGSILKLSNRCRKLTQPLSAHHNQLHLSDAGVFEWNAIHELVRNAVPLQLKLDSHSGRYAHFAFTQRQEDRAVAKLLSFIETDQCHKVADVHGLPICHHFRKKELLKVILKLAKNAKTRMDDRETPLKDRPAVKTNVLRCSYCPSEYRLSVNLRRLSVQFGHSVLQKHVAPHFEWAQESSDIHVVFERWVDLGLFKSPHEEQWRSLVKGEKRVRGRSWGRKWNWSGEGRERARLDMEGNDEVCVWKIKDMV
ncbi:MAG: hypothetical protein Q9159_007636 [Coniocarpon cinnabarinum]